VTFRNTPICLRYAVSSPTAIPQAGRPPLAVCLRLLIQYTSFYISCLVAVSSTCELRTRHAVVTRDCLTWDFNI
jgi:hypothetical protein